MNAPLGQTVDPVTLEIIRNLLIAILDEGELNLERTAFSPIIYEVKDYCFGLLDKQGRIIAQSRGGIPTFMADLGEPVCDGLQIYGEHGFDPGDVLLMNYSEVCGQHLNNMVLYMPIHWEGKLIGFAATRAHWTDVGGATVGSAANNTTEIFQEGIQLRSVKAYKGGEPDEEIMRILRHNIRFPELTFGDMAAQIGACKLTSTRFIEMIKRYGLDTIEPSIRRIWDQSEAYARQQISLIPDGRYDAESFLDDDGIDLDRTLPVKVALIVKGGELTVDFTGTAPQSRGPMNSGRSGGRAAARVAFKSALVPDLPPNDGTFRALKVVLPEGTIISAVNNAALSRWNLVLKTVIDTIYLALSQAVPERVNAGHFAAQGTHSFFGLDRTTGRRFLAQDTVLGGWGARHDADGFSPLKTAAHGDTRNVPLEVEELCYPLLPLCCEWRPDTGGAGEFRGGLGVRKVYRVLQDCNTSFAMERTKCPPWGLFGGKSAKTGGVLVRRPGKVEPEWHLKATNMPLEAGTIVELLSPGGGGRGHPAKRAVERVIEDVKQGYVTTEGARRDYGVVLDAVTLAVDEEATNVLRQQMLRAEEEFTASSPVPVHTQTMCRQ